MQEVLYEECAEKRKIHGPIDARGRVNHAEQGRGRVSESKGKLLVKWKNSTRGGGGALQAGGRTGRDEQACQDRAGNARLW